VEVPPPELRHSDEVLVRIRAAALNRLDLWMTEGLPNVSPAFPFIVGSDGAGEVAVVGSEVRDLAVGDRVMINPGISCAACPSCIEGDEPLCREYRLLGEHVPGTATEYVVLPARNLAPAPAAMSWAEAAGFSLTTLTAWRMLATRARLRAGETVLIWGIGGGVALAALQVALVLGARPIVTSGTPAKLETARAMGAFAALDHGRDDVVAEVRNLTGGRGADVVIDSVGERTWATSLRALARGGRVVVCGATTGPAAAFDLRRLFWYQWSILGSTMGSRREYAEIVRLAHQGRLRTVVDRVVPLADAVAAYERMRRGEQTGKLVLEVRP
jgi:NADPH:quinone reductase-like Zn-dependent oxidoreductase